MHHRAVDRQAGGCEMRLSPLQNVVHLSIEKATLILSDIPAVGETSRQLIVEARGFVGLE